MKNNNNINLNKPIGAAPNSKVMKEYKATLSELSKVQLDAAIGNALGDSSIQTQNKGRDYRIKFEWGGKNKEYAQHIFDLFDEWILSPALREQRRMNHLGNEVITWCFQTFSHPAFNIIAHLFLDDNGKKTIPNPYRLVMDYVNERV